MEEWLHKFCVSPINGASFFFMFPQLDSVPSICAWLAYYKEERGVLQ